MKRNTIVLWSPCSARHLCLGRLGQLGVPQAGRPESVASAALQADLSSAANPEARPIQSPLLGKPAPAFTLEDLSGKKVSLADYKGKALLINFWATWCGPCKLETPWLVELQNQYGPQGFDILGIDSEDDDLAPDDKAGFAKDKAAVARFVKQEHMPYPVLLNGDSITKEYGDFEAMPTSFFVNRSGKVIAMQMGITCKKTWP